MLLRYYYILAFNKLSIRHVFISLNMFFVFFSTLCSCSLLSKVSILFEPDGQLFHGLTDKHKREC